ncbi:hypothetical protein QJS04_geneDACA006549 [Acorus gramineus]|uniref:Nucleoporin p58/p45 n=1 Tax=Acorus gramineus TaxID=55184 RepID=A0AAV9AXQ2_ACOGR|nr:hypothetical protein QJS04_geneDACA006549 [Acorus gramineus]
MQELGVTATAMERERVLVQELMSVVKGLLRNTEVAVRSFMMLRPRFLHANVAPVSSIGSSAQTSGGMISSNPAPQPTSSSIVPVFDFYTGFPRRPSPFLQETFARFEKYLSECHQWIEELEQVLLTDTNETTGSGLSLVHSLPKVMSNVHDFFVHVAAKVERLHQYVESMKTAYLVDQRRRGDGNDPFLEADRRETAKQEAAARRVHPTLHVPAMSQPSTQVAGLLTSSATVGASNVSQPLMGSSAASSGGGLSIFSTPSSAPSASTSSFLFHTPSTSAPTSSIFGSTGATPGAIPQTSLFGTSSSAQTPSLFGSNTPFSSTPATGNSPLFSTPFASGAAALGSGATFGTTTKTTKPKTRTTRR